MKKVFRLVRDLEDTEETIVELTNLSVAQEAYKYVKQVLLDEDIEIQEIDIAETPEEAESIINEYLCLVTDEEVEETEIVSLEDFIPDLSDYESAPIEEKKNKITKKNFADALAKLGK